MKVSIAGFDAGPGSGACGRICALLKEKQSDTRNDAHISNANARNNVHRGDAKVYIT